MIMGRYLQTLRMRQALEFMMFLVFRRSAVLCLSGQISMSRILDRWTIYMRWTSSLDGLCLISMVRETGAELYTTVYAEVN